MTDKPNLPHLKYALLSVAAFSRRCSFAAIIHTEVTTQIFHYANYNRPFLTLMKFNGIIFALSSGISVHALKRNLLVLFVPVNEGESHFQLRCVSHDVATHSLVSTYKTNFVYTL